MNQAPPTAATGRFFWLVFTTNRLSCISAEHGTIGNPSKISQDFPLKRPKIPSVGEPKGVGGTKSTGGSDLEPKWQDQPRHPNKKRAAQTIRLTHSAIGDLIWTTWRFSLNYMQGMKSCCSPSGLLYLVLFSPIFPAPPSMTLKLSVSVGVLSWAVHMWGVQIWCIIKRTCICVFK